MPLFTVNGGNGSSLLLQKGTVIKNAKKHGDCGMLIEQKECYHDSVYSIAAPQAKIALAALRIQ